MHFWISFLLKLMRCSKRSPTLRAVLPILNSSSLLLRLRLRSSKTKVLRVMHLSLHLLLFLLPKSKFLRCSSSLNKVPISFWPMLMPMPTPCVPRQIKRHAKSFAKPLPRSKMSSTKSTVSSNRKKTSAARTKRCCSTLWMTLILCFRVKAQMVLAIFRSQVPKRSLKAR